MLSIKTGFVLEARELLERLAVQLHDLVVWVEDELKDVFERSYVFDV